MKLLVLITIGALSLIFTVKTDLAFAQGSEKFLYETTSKDRAQRALRYLQKRSPKSGFQISEITENLRPTIFVFGPFASKSQAEHIRSQFLKSRRPARVFEKGGQFLLMTPKLIGRSDRSKFQNMAQSMKLNSIMREIQLPTEEVTLYRIITTPPSGAKDSEVAGASSESGEDLGSGLIIIGSDDTANNSDLEFSSADQVSQGDLSHKWRWNIQLSPLYFYEMQELGGIALGRVGNEFAIGSQAHLKLKANVQSVLAGTDSQIEFLIDELSLHQDVSDFRFSLGWQKIIWGQVFENSAFDRISRYNMIQGFEGKLEDRRVAVPLIRLEYTQPFFKVDLIAGQNFQGTVLPRPGINPWSLTDTEKGIIPGVDQSPVTTALVREGSFQANYEDSIFTRGARVTVSKSGFDIGATYVKTPWNQPTYYLNPEVLAQLAIGIPPQTAISASDEETFLLFYPETEVFGFDLRSDLGLVNLGVELARVTHYPATHETFLPTTVPVWMWVVSTEWYPGDGNDQINLQMVSISGEFKDTLEERGPTYLLGQWQTYFLRREWQGTLRTFYFLGEPTGSLHLNIAWLLHEPHRLALDSYYYWGASDTLGEAWQKARAIGVSWSYVF